MVFYGNIMATYIYLRIPMPTGESGLETSFVQPTDFHLTTDFTPFGVETFAPWGLRALFFYKILSQNLIDCLGGLRASRDLAQRINIAMQRGNVGSSGVSCPGDPFSTT